MSTDGGMGKLNAMYSIARMGLEGIMLTEVSQAKSTYHIFSFTVETTVHLEDAETTAEVMKAR